MNSDHIVEEPAIRAETHSPLSPVSPKPIHYPAPSNIPVLANQMDPVFNDTSTHLNATGPKSPPLQNNHTPLDESATQDTSNPITTEADQPAVPDNQSLAVDQNTVTAASPINFQDPAFLSLLASSQAIAANQSGSGENQSGAEGAQDHTQLLLDPSGHGYGTEGNPGVTSPLAQVAPEGVDATGTNTSQLNSNVNIQALLDSLAASAAKANHNAATASAGATPVLPQQVAESGNLASDSLDASNSAILPQLNSSANLPPRPTQAAAPGADLSSLTSNGQTLQQTGYGLPPGTSYQALGSLPPPPAAVGAPGTTNVASGLPPPPGPSFQQGDASQGYGQQSATEGIESDIKGDEDVPWGPEVQKIYDSFLQDERNYVTEGQWDKFPPNSRLFIGNLPTEKVTKRDLFHVFHRYGKLAQISIKQAYGFIQFLDSDACFQALQAEQNMQVRGRKMHLEISKPQKNTRKGGDGDGRGRNRRSRSPDHGRGGGGGGRQGDRYRGGQQNNRQRVRDDYRPGRSPSPRNAHGRGGRSPDRYNGRRRSRSRSPYGRGRRRSPSPRRDAEDGLPLPRREPRDVPDVQIIVVDNFGVDRGFTKYVEDAFKARGLRSNALILSPLLSEPAVVRRQIVEGVVAVMKLNRTTQNTQKFSLQVFDRSAGADNVRFEEYHSLDLHIAIEIVMQKKQSQPNIHRYPDPAAAYAAAQFGLPPAPARQPIAPISTNPIASMDSTELQRLLGQLQSPTGPPQHQQHRPLPNAPSGPVDLSRLLSGITSQSSPYQQPPHVPQPVPYSTASLASLLGHPAVSPPGNPSQQQQPAPDMQSILAQLGKYKQ